MWCAQSPGLINAGSPEGAALREKIDDHLTENGYEGKSRGADMDSRYHSPVIYQDTNGMKEPDWDPSKYAPSTYMAWRSGAAPVPERRKDQYLGPIRQRMDTHHGIHVLPRWPTCHSSLHESRCSTKYTSHIEDEDHVRHIWKRIIALVRPDGHVARLPIEDILQRMLWLWL